jgi:hypothetical protein
MQDFFDCLISHNGLAYGTGLVIFLITAFLAAKRVIGVTLTTLFLLFALLASLAVANQDSIKNYLNTLDKQQAADGTYRAAGGSEEATWSDKLERAFEDLKKEYEVQKEKLEKMAEDFNKDNAPAKNGTPKK